ncbi:cupin domain-containing protein [Amycolatopsis rhabdoformis]|uniref:Cupin domain-containing protein n=1 Tax=Amycolatopsis rhabdoformis TaxID=1448059 RepID=A0ABZ1IAU6_9PSEU|nr:cupin domain-containing protein [Amycolatopsis rhabdoformis]WSE31258.1 cupin domain-containing protein [Amycolatopsis rhabdoformis]
MIGMRIAGGVLTVAALTGATACAASDQPAAAPASATTMVMPAAASQPPAETLTPLLQQALPNANGKNFTSAIVTFPPGARAAAHRHGDAFVYAYVLDGTVRSQLEGQPVSTFHQGQNWIEQPGSHHVLTENTSTTEQARLLVVFVADPGAQLKVDDPHS